VMLQNPYQPRVGDLVQAQGQNGTFRVVEVRHNPSTADLELLSPSDGDFSLRGRRYRLRTVPWAALLKID
jgi:hypothetical protein